MTGLPSMPFLVKVWLPLPSARKRTMLPLIAAAIFVGEAAETVD
jgi:hypothetical protein